MYLLDKANWKHTLRGLASIPFDERIMMRPTKILPTMTTWVEDMLDEDFLDILLDESSVEPRDEERDEEKSKM